MTDIQKRLSDVELANIAQYLRFVCDGGMDHDGPELMELLKGTHRAAKSLLSHISASTPEHATRQGKVERARELLALKLGMRAADLRDDYPISVFTAIAAITQALTESSGQGTDGAEDRIESNRTPADLLNGLRHTVGTTGYVGIKRPVYDGIVSLLEKMASALPEGTDGACCEAMREWQPIETAPKDREIIVCGGNYMQDGCTFDDWYPHQGIALVTHMPDIYSKEKVWRGENAGGHDEYFWYRPTHWMDKPKPIKSKQPDTGAGK